MASLFEAYITNLGKYNEGELVGETLEFPTSPQEVQTLLKHIGVDGIRYEEFFITSFDGDVLGLYDYLGEYENLDELNHLACLLSELDQGELEKFEAVLHTGAHTSSVADIINLTQNLDCFEFYPDIENEEDLGRYWAEDLPIPEELKDYFDYEASLIFPCTRTACASSPAGSIRKPWNMRTSIIPWQAPRIRRQSLAAGAHSSTTLTALCRSSFPLSTAAPTPEAATR